mmetsp:Transcript_17255/g.47188  ORF Transcript_17255/g.47188 Transcript_17255/m.47188 type:complete len:201 (+) Transcript_17255:142-744(+)
MSPKESVPAKGNVISTRDNSDYKWQQQRSVIGALEVPSEPDLDFSGELLPRYVKGSESAFDDALEIWNEQKLRKQFIKACKNVPPASFCCGMLTDKDAWIKNIQKSLTKGWVKATNQKFRSEQKLFMLDVFIWNWHNATGKSKTSILLIRFHESKRQSLLKNGSSAVLSSVVLDEKAIAGVTDQEDPSASEGEPLKDETS